MDFDAWLERQTLQTRFVLVVVLCMIEILIVGLGFDMIVDSLGILVGFFPPNILTLAIDPSVFSVVRSLGVFSWSFIMVYLIVLKLDSYLLGVTGWRTIQN